MLIKDKAFAGGVNAAKRALSLQQAMKECPWQSSALRQAFIDGWRSVLDP